MTCGNVPGFWLLVPFGVLEREAGCSPQYRVGYRQELDQDTLDKGKVLRALPLNPLYSGLTY